MEFNHPLCSPPEVAAEAFKGLNFAVPRFQTYKNKHLAGRAEVEAHVRTVTPLYVGFLWFKLTMVINHE